MDAGTSDGDEDLEISLIRGDEGGEDDECNGDGDGDGDFDEDEDAAEEEEYELEGTSRLALASEVSSSAPSVDGGSQLIPRVGMCFATEDDAYEFYKRYAVEKGFVVRKSNKSKNSRHRVTRRLFVCHRQGFRQDQPSQSSSAEGTAADASSASRTGCLASLVIKLIPCGAFRVTDFIESHNHPLAVPLHQTESVLRDDPREGPRVDMLFPSEEDAYDFYNAYAAHVGFSVRRSYKKRKRGLLMSRIFVCSREGGSEKTRSDGDPSGSGNNGGVAALPSSGVGGHQRPGPPPTRTGCHARMVIKLTPCRTFRVAKFVPDHNHALANPSNIHKLRSHKMKAKALELGSPEYQHRKRTKGVQVGDAGAALEYLQGLQIEHPSIHYAVGTSVESGSGLNFFWTDARSVVDFSRFGDVVCFDTTYFFNSFGRLFALFVGVDNYKQMVVFGSALLSDDSAESIVWVFEAFSKAMKGRPPLTILTDNGPIYSNAVAAVWPTSMHQVFVWHLYHNAKKHVRHAFETAKSFASSFSSCLFECEEEHEFLSRWEKLIEKHDVGSNEWLAGLYSEKEKWALPYTRHVFTADILSTMRKDSMISLVRRELSDQKDLKLFLYRFEKALDEHRSRELHGDAEGSQITIPMPSLRMLKQAANAYTPVVFKMFQTEFEIYMNCMAYQCGGVGTTSEYKVTVDERPSEYNVKYDNLDGSVTCSCKKFESVGIQCAHVLKIFDFKNIKELPLQSILRRWTKDAKYAIGGSAIACDSINTLQLTAEGRSSYLCRISSILASRAAKSIEAMRFIDSQSAVIMKQLDQILQNSYAEVGDHDPTASNLTHSIIRTQHHNLASRANLVSTTPDGTSVHMNL